MPDLLAGYRVLDLTIAMAGPLATLRLGDLGADVVKVEPIEGEWQRHKSAGSAVGRQINTSFLSLNRNKRSLAIDLKHPQAPAVVERLISSADVIVQNYRVGVADRLGFGYERAASIRPDIVYVSLSGYGETGPYRDLPGQDLLLQGLSGMMMSAMDAEGVPQAAPTYVVDAVTGYTAFEAVLAGLLHRERTGEGQYITINMLDAAISFQMQEMSIFTAGGVPQEPVPHGHANTYIRAPYAPFRTRDSFVILAFPPLSLLGEVLGVPELLSMDDEVDGHVQRDRIHELVSQAMLTRTTDEWLQMCNARGIWAGRVHGYADMITDPQVVHNGSLVTYEHPTEGIVTTPGFPYQFSRTPARVERGAPLAGEHTVQILESVGFDDAQIRAFAAEKLVAMTQPGE